LAPPWPNWRPSTGITGPGWWPNPRFLIRQGRHPVIERVLASGSFVPNDIALDADSQVLIVTGPNMSGKSTILRQVALITLLAHLGSFVPAAEAVIGLTDRIFTRVGAVDDIGRGQSTFLVEMHETARILPPGHSPEPGDLRRDRPGHLHLRRPGPGLGRSRTPPRP